MFYRFFDKKTSGGTIKSMPNQRPLDLAMQTLANELQKLLKNLKEEEFILHLKIKFGVLI